MSDPTSKGAGSNRGHVAQTRCPGHFFLRLDPDIIDEELIGQLDLLDVASPVTDLIAQLNVERDLTDPARLGSPGLFAIHVEHVLGGGPQKAEVMESFHHVWYTGDLPRGPVILPVAVPVNRMVDPIVEPGLLHDVDLGAIPPSSPIVPTLLL